MIPVVGIERVTLHWQPEVTVDEDTIRDAGWLMPGDKPLYSEGRPLWCQAVCAALGSELLPSLFVRGQDAQLEVSLEDQGPEWFQIAVENDVDEDGDGDFLTSVTTLWRPNQEPYRLDSLTDGLKDLLSSHDAIWFRQASPGPVGPTA